MPKTIKFIVRPCSSFPVPDSEGYSIYSALLNRMSESDEDTGRRVHGTDFSSISISGLDGSFKPSERDHHKTLPAGETYELKVGVTDPTEVAIFQSLLKPLIFDGKTIELTHGELEVMETVSNSQSFKELAAEAARHVAGGIESISMEFLTPTCIQYKRSEITEMFPHRMAVFNSLASKWNRTCPEELSMEIERDELGSKLIEKPAARSYRTHSVVVNRVFDDSKGHRRPIFRQGFTGRCEYMFGNLNDEGFREEIVTLAHFGEYAGVGSAVARGCGTLEVIIND